MARRVFFSLHYNPDVQRSEVVKKSQFLRGKELAGFFDSSAMEEAQRKDPDSLRLFLRKEMEGSSVVCVLIGQETAKRHWVRFEILQGLVDSRGIVGVRVHAIADFNRRVAQAGPNPFDVLGVYSKDGSVYLVERSADGTKWQYTNDFGQKPLQQWPYTPKLPQEGTSPLSKFFKVHQWADEGHSNIGDWVEAAAKEAGR